MMKRMLKFCLVLLVGFVLVGCDSNTEVNGNIDNTINDDNKQDEVINRELVHGELNYFEEYNNEYVYIDLNILDLSSIEEFDDMVEVCQQFPASRVDDLRHIFIVDGGQYTFMIDDFKALYYDNDGYTYHRSISYDNNDNSISHKTESYYDEEGNRLNSHEEYVKIGSYKDTVYHEDGSYTETLTKKYDQYQIALFKEVYGTYRYVWMDTEKRIMEFDYNEEGNVIRFKSYFKADDETVEWILDGKGKEMENCISLTLTVGESSTTYYGSDIPFGRVMDYPNTNYYRYH